MSLRTRAQSRDAQARREPSLPPTVRRAHARGNAGLCAWALNRGLARQLACATSPSNTAWPGAAAISLQDRPLSDGRCADHRLRRRRPRGTPGSRWPSAREHRARRPRRGTNIVGHPSGSPGHRRPSVPAGGRLELEAVHALREPAGLVGQLGRRVIDGLRRVGDALRHRLRLGGGRRRRRSHARYGL